MEKSEKKLISKIETIMERYLLMRENKEETLDLIEAALKEAGYLSWFENCEHLNKTPISGGGWWCDTCKRTIITSNI